MKLMAERKGRISVPCGHHISLWRPKFIVLHVDGTLLAVPRRSKGAVIVENKCVRFQQYYNFV